MSDDAAQETLSDDMRIFVDRVRGEAALERHVDAEVLTRATVRALGEQISPASAEHLTASLSEELAAEITAHGSGTATFDRDAFLDRVASEIPGGLDREQAERQAHAVLAVMRSSSPDGQVEGTLAELPAPLAALFA